MHDGTASMIGRVVIGVLGVFSAAATLSSAAVILNGGGGRASSAAYAIESAFEPVGSPSRATEVVVEFGWVAQGAEPEVAEPATVVGRWIFYNRSAWDGNNAAANPADDGAIATDKRALLPGQTAGFANYTSYSRGINGLMIDVARLAGAPNLADFVLTTGNDATPGDWVAAPVPVALTVRPGPGSSARLTLVWEDGSIRGKWLRVELRATANTGLAASDVFYFGNAVGESGDRAGVDALVNATDELRARANPRSAFSPAPVDSPYDFNRDRLVNATDQLIARSNTRSAFTALRLIQAPRETPAPFGPAAWTDAEADGNSPGRADLQTIPRPLPPPVRLRVLRRADGWIEVGLVTSRAGLELEISEGQPTGPWRRLGAESEEVAWLETGWMVRPRAASGAAFFRVVDTGQAGEPGTPPAATRLTRLP